MQWSRVLPHDPISTPCTVFNTDGRGSFILLVPLTCFVIYTTTWMTLGLFSLPRSCSLFRVSPILLLWSCVSLPVYSSIQELMVQVSPCHAHNIWGFSSLPLSESFSRDIASLIADPPPFPITPLLWQSRFFLLACSHPLTSYSTALTVQGSYWLAQSSLLLPSCSSPNDQRSTSPRFHFTNASRLGLLLSTPLTHVPGLETHCIYGTAWVASVQLLQRTDDGSPFSSALSTSPARCTAGMWETHLHCFAHTSCSISFCLVHNLPH